MSMKHSIVLFGLMSPHNIFIFSDHDEMVPFEGKKGEKNQNRWRMQNMDEQTDNCVS